MESVSVKPFANAGHAARIALMRLHPQRMLALDPEAFWQHADEAFPQEERKAVKRRRSKTKKDAR